MFTQAATLFEQAIKLNPEYADAYASLGHAYFDMKQWDKAIPALEQALALNPKHKDSRKGLGGARLAQKKERKKKGEKSKPATQDEAQNNRPGPSPTATKVAADETSL